jgi:hypothetical protein
MSYPPGPPGLPQQPFPQPRPPFPPQRQGMPPGYGGVYGQQGPQWSPGKPPKKRRTGLIVVLSLTGVLLVVAGTVTAIVVATSGGGAKTQGSSIFDAKTGFKPGAQITPDTLAKTDPESILLVMLHKQLTAPYVTVTDEVFDNQQAADAHDTSAANGTNQARIDFLDQKAATGNDDQLAGFVQNRCIDGKEYVASYSPKEGELPHWKPDPKSDVFCADIRSANTTNSVADALVPGGLGDSKATQFVKYVTSQYGDPFQVGRPELFTHNGKQYVKLPVTFKGVQTSEGLVTSKELFGFAYGSVGGDPRNDLFPSPGNLWQADFFIDPQTTLPAYSVRRDLPVPGLPQGADDPPLQIYHAQYDFPQQWHDYSLNNPADLALFSITWDNHIQ